jgi:hypothetical protein
VYSIDSWIYFSTFAGLILAAAKGYLIFCLHGVRTQLVLGVRMGEVSIGGK